MYAAGLSPGENCFGSFVEVVMPEDTERLESDAQQEVSDRVRERKLDPAQSFQQILGAGQAAAGASVHDVLPLVGRCSCPRPRSAWRATSSRR